MTLRPGNRRASAEPAAPRRDPGRYMTDGTNLYRFVGWLTRGRLAELEDCRSLAILVTPAEEIESSRLLPVRCESS